MANCATHGWEFRLAVRSGAWSDSQDLWIEAVGVENYYPSVVGVTEEQEHVPVPGVTGFRDMFSAETIPGNRVAGGPLRFRFGRSALDAWLPRILGASEATDVFKVANDLPWFQLLIDKGQGKYFEYRDCKVARAVFSGSTGGAVTMDLEIVGKKEEESAETFPALIPTPSLSTRPIRFAEGNFVWDPAGTPVEGKFEQFQLIVDNMIDPSFYAGDDAATCLDVGRRTVTLALPAAHTDAVKNMYKRGFEGLAGRLQWVADNMTTKVEMPCLKWAKRSTTMESEGRIFLPLQMRAYRSVAGDSGADDSIKITNDPVFAS